MAAGRITVFVGGWAASGGGEVSPLWACAAADVGALTASQTGSSVVAPPHFYLHPRLIYSPVAPLGQASGRSRPASENPRPCWSAATLSVSRRRGYCARRSPARLAASPPKCCGEEATLAAPLHEDAACFINLRSARGSRRDQIPAN